MNKIDVIILLYKVDIQEERLLNQIFKQQDIIINNLILIASRFNEEVLLKINKGNCKIKKILFNQNELSHSVLRNRALDLVEAEFVIYLTGDVSLIDEFCFYRLINKLDKNRSAASFARQIPRGHLALFLKAEMEQEYKNKDEIYDINSEKIFLSNVCAAYKTDILKKYKFNEKINICEDLDFAKRIIDKGYKIYYCSSAIVEHSHNWKLIDYYKRNIEYGKTFKLLHISINKTTGIEKIKTNIAKIKYIYEHSNSILNFINNIFLFFIYKITAYIGLLKGKYL